MGTESDARIKNDTRGQAATDYWLIPLLFVLGVACLGYLAGVIGYV